MRIKIINQLIALFLAVSYLFIVASSAMAADSCQWERICTNTATLERVNDAWTNSCGVTNGTYTNGSIKTTWTAVIDRSRVKPGTRICPDPSGWCVVQPDYTPGHTGTCGNANIDLSNCWNTNGSPFGLIAVVLSIDEWRCPCDPSVDRCCENPDPCCGSPDPCCGKDSCCNNPDPCCGDTDCGQCKE